MKLIQLGSKGKDVTAWKGFLVDNNFLASGQTSDVFDSKTHEATLLFQTEYGLIVDGKVGKNTILKATEFGFEEPSEFTREITEIIVHITANGNGKTGQELFNYIDKMHRDNGWDGCGYHWLIDKNGLVIKGRDENIVGSHCKAQGKNNGTLAIAYDSRGNDKTPYAPYGKYMTEPQKISFENLLKEKMAEFNIGTKDVHGHNFYDKNKACPCFSVEKSKEFQNAIK